MTGFEPMTFYTQNKRATNYATSRFKNNFLEVNGLEPLLLRMQNVHFTN